MIAISRVRVGLACVVTVIWAVGYMLAFTNGNQQPTELSGLMAVVLSWAFAGEVRDAIKRRNGNGGSA